MYDLLILNGTVIDGSGSPPYQADIGIEAGKIAAIGKLDGHTARQTIDAAGRWVTPGFIDMHSHGDATLLFYPEMPSVLKQGVTTIVGGQCGMSIAPCDRYWVSQYFEIECMKALTNNMLNTPDLVPPCEIGPLLKGRYGVDLDFASFGGYLDKAEKQGVGASFVPLVGHGTIRAQVLGKDYRRTATQEEVERMAEYLKEAMEAGARGMSVGLDYAPGIYADFDELLALAKALRPYGGIYEAHWRKTGLREGTPKRQKKIDGIIETLEIGLQAGIQVHLSHLSVGFDTYPSTDDYMVAQSAKRTLEVIEGYRKKGVRVYHDVIPNITGGILLDPDLMMTFMQWAMPCGSREQFAKNLRAPDYREDITEYVNAGKLYALNPQVNPEWAEYITVIQHLNTDYVGKTIDQLAGELSRSPLAVALDLLAEDPCTKVFSAVQNLRDASIRVFLGDENGTVSSDTFAFDLTPTMGLDRGMPCYYPNPNTYCAFVRYLTEYPQATVEATIRKATGKPAEIMGLSDRGVLAEGKRADVLVIDHKNLRTNENHIDPRVYPEGIEYVVVGGALAVNNGKLTGARQGQVVRSWEK